ncbi:hypothetical protein [Phenylobacterium ferrooxidans]|uniref:Uncharacterized protein n=1 Tax=Phenylobacterium ferrooxidans TaxID=2982689 RepID=A0ABW6CRN9_9CAUL|nr:hypothetical protein [Phenylobacterium sp.]
MRFLIAATAALSVLGGSAALAQPYGYSGQQGYYDQQPYYGQQQQYRGQNYGGGSYAPPVQHGYAQPYGANGYSGGSAYYGAQAYGYNNRAPVYSYNNRSDRHVRREHRRDRDRHYVAPRGGYDRHR